MDKPDYKKAYQRQKLARECAEKNLEDKARDLYEANKLLVETYNRLKDQKAQLLHQEKLASIGQLAAGIAHEINNPTGFVKSNLNTLANYVEQLTAAVHAYEQLAVKLNSEVGTGLDKVRQQFDVSFVLDDMPALINESLDGIGRIEDIVASLKSFARPDHDDNREFSINDCIENTLKLVKNEIKYKAELQLNLGEIPPISGNSGALGQVMLNLVMNAVDAIEDHGQIVICTEVDDSNVKIVVRDSGRGIPQNMITRIFDPFFTTKDVGKGTGLGLAISHGIVKKHGGSLMVRSEEGSGSEFTIALPLSTRHPNRFS